LAAAGADVSLVDCIDPTALAEIGEAYGRKPVSIDPETFEERAYAFVFDATDLESPADLRRLWDFFHPMAKKIRACGRVVILARPPADAKTVAAAAAQNALDGFGRSLGKEWGKRGVTVNTVFVPDGVENRLDGPLRFFLDARSAYVTGQPLTLSKRARASAAAGWTFPLDGKVVLVTGAARGIGRATARVFASEGAKVICLDRPEDASEAAQLAREINGTVLGVDITAEDAAEQIISAGKDAGGIDVIVHNAGITRDRTIAKMKPEYWDMTLGVNLGAIQHITAAMLEAKAINTGGRIICLSSVGGIAGNMGQTNYGAAKAGVIGLVRALASKTAKRGITVNAIAPGFIETRMTAAMPAGLREVARRLNSLSQGGRPVDVGEAIAFLATPQADGVTGQVLRVCGQALIGA
jgi:3-oxoacyl-[acyl-carrier protein] reductase